MQESKTTYPQPPQTSPELKAAWKWVNDWIDHTKHSSPPWEWYEMMKLKDAIVHLQNDMELPKRVFAKVEEVK